MKTFAAALLAATALSAPALAEPWIAGLEIVRGPNGGETITGHVFGQGPQPSEHRGAVRLGR